MQQEFRLAEVAASGQQQKVRNISIILSVCSFEWNFITLVHSDLALDLHGDPNSTACDVIPS